MTIESIDLTERVFLGAQVDVGAEAVGVTPW